MQISNEIKEVVQEIYDAMSKGKVEEFGKLLSLQAGALVIGTDPSTTGLK